MDYLRVYTPGAVLFYVKAIYPGMPALPEQRDNKPPVRCTELDQSGYSGILFFTSAVFGCIQRVSQEARSLWLLAASCQPVLWNWNVIVANLVLSSKF